MQQECLRALLWLSQVKAARPWQLLRQHPMFAMLPAAALQDIEQARLFVPLCSSALPAHHLLDDCPDAAVVAKQMLPATQNAVISASEADRLCWGLAMSCSVRERRRRHGWPSMRRGT